MNSPPTADLPASPGRPTNADSRFQKSRFPSNALEENKPRDEPHPLFASQKFDPAPEVAYGSVAIIHRTALLSHFCTTGVMELEGPYKERLWPRVTGEGLSEAT